MNFDPKQMSREQLRAVVNGNYPGIAMFARDVNLPPELAKKYVPGQIIREKAFTDASIRFMGMVTTHRYVILSNHMADLSQLEHGTNWGLCVANKDSHFKVLGQYSCGGKTGIFLLHLPDDDSWKLWQQVEVNIDRELYQKSVQRFVAKCGQAPVPELTTPQWLDRCAFPLGMSDSGELWPLEDTPVSKPVATAPKQDKEPELPKEEPLKPLRPVGLMYTPLTKRAVAICFNAHKNQRDKSGLPYVFHPFHLAEQMETEQEVCAALLHDVIEDSGYTLAELSQAGFPQEVVEAVGVLTRDPYMQYLDYVAKVRRNPIARRVKLADLKHNSDLARLGTITEQDKGRVLKYRMAQAILEDDFYDASMDHFRKRLPLSLENPVYLSVFYSRGGQVLKYSLDLEYAEDSHYDFSAEAGEKLRRKVAVNRTLPEALAEQKLYSCTAIESLLHQCGIPFQPYHYD